MYQPALAINSVHRELAETVAFCRAQNLGLELTSWAFPANLEGDQPRDLAAVTALVQGVPLITVHGPFFDLVATSPDPAIVDLTRRRQRTALAAAIHLKARVMVAHVNNNPLIRNPGYRNLFVQKMAEFWSPVADEAGKAGVTIALENMWEAGPELQADILAAARHPHLKATFDNGHALAYSTVPAKQWIETLGAGLAYCHLHDNHGELDEHLPIGTPGCRENWPAYLAAVAAHAPAAILTIESDKLALNQQSLQALREHLAASHAKPR